MTNQTCVKKCSRFSILLLLSEVYCCSILLSSLLLSFNRALVGDKFSRFCLYRRLILGSGMEVVMIQTSRKQMELLEIAKTGVEFTHC